MFFFKKRPLFSFLDIKLGHFIVITLNFYVKKWESLTAKIENEE
jgi:hypothetical protein